MKLSQAMHTLTQIWKIFYVNWIIFLRKKILTMRTCITVNIDISYISNLHVELKSKCLWFFHLNINSLSKHFDNFNHLINKLELELEFDILGISDSRILKSQSLNTNVTFRIMSSNKHQLNQLQEGFCYILIRNILIKLILTLPFISQKNLNQLFYWRKALDVFINICAWIYAYLMIINLISCYIIYPRKPIKQLFS